MTKRLALFDLDGTLLLNDSDHAWGEYLVEHQLVDRKAYQKANDQFYRDYQQGTLDIQTFLNFTLAPLARIPLSQLKELRADFIKTLIPAQVAFNIKSILDEHLARSDVCAIITATNDFVTAPIAEYFRVPLISTVAQFKDGRYTGRPQGIPCFREHKITKLNEWLNANHAHISHFSHSFFYSDSINDLPLLKYVDHPCAVNPDAQLIKLAKQHNWPHLTHT